MTGMTKKILIFILSLFLTLTFAMSGLSANAAEPSDNGRADGGAEASESPPPGRVFGLDKDTLIGVGLQLFNAALLAVVLSRILYKPVRNFMGKRAERISSQLSQAEEGVAEANRLKAQYEQKLADIELERIEILDAAREIAVEKNKQMMEEGRKEVATLKERASADVQRERERLREEISLHILEVSLEIASKFVQHTIDKETQDRMFEETIAELEETTWLS